MYWFTIFTDTITAAAPEPINYGKIVFILENLMIVFVLFLRIISRDNFRLVLLTFGFDLFTALGSWCLWQCL